MEKKFSYGSGTVTVHNIESWPSERLRPILADYLSEAEELEVSEDAA